MSNFYGATGLTGGGVGALDDIDGGQLGDGDGAMVKIPTSGEVYQYTLDADSGATESSPNVITPDANAGTRRWLLCSSTPDKYYVNSSAADQGASSHKSIKALVDAIGPTKKATLVLTHNGVADETAYTLTTNETIPSNITLEIENGAVIDGAGTLTVDGVIIDEQDIVLKQNILINQDFSIWQKAISFTNPATNVYTADGYQVYKADGGGTAPSISVMKSTAVKEVGFSQTCQLNITNVGVPDSSRRWAFRQFVENFEKYRGKTLTFSIRLRASATINFSNAEIRILDGVNSSATAITSIGTSFITFSITYAIATAATQLLLHLYLDGGNGTISTTGSIYIQWMKLEQGNKFGSVATPLIPRSTGEELALCQRRRQKSYAQGVLPGATTSNGARSISMNGFNSADHTIKVSTKLISPMIDAPTVTIYDTLGNSGKVTMVVGPNIVGTVSNIVDSGFVVSGTNGAVTTSRVLTYHYFAEYDL